MLRDRAVRAGAVQGSARGALTGTRDAAGVRLAMVSGGQERWVAARRELSYV